MTRIQKRKLVIYLGLGMLVTVVFAAALPQMELQPGLPAPRLEGYHIVLPETESPTSVDLSTFPFVLRLIGMVASIYLLVALFLAIMGTGTKTLIRKLRELSLIAGIFVLIVLALLLLQHLPAQPARLVTRPTPSPPYMFSPADTAPTSLIWIVGGAIAVIGALLLLYWITQRRRSLQLDLLAEQAEKARQNILVGRRLDEVILDCYQQMGSVIQHERGIERQLYTTASEFEQELYSAGLPQAPVHELTRLFEKVRYGFRAADYEDEQSALASLQSIINHLHHKQN